MKKLYVLISSLLASSVVYAQTTNDVKVVSAKLDKFLVVGTQTFIKATLKNVGSNSISSVEINWNDGTGDHKERITAYLSANQQREVTHPIALSFSDPSVLTRNITISVSKVNDADDGNPADNAVNVQNSIVSQQISRKVVFEEGTGTWCGYCPRGMVALKQVNELYPNDQISIAVHNNDPMADATYNSGMALTGWPGMHVNREIKAVDPNPGSINNYVETRKNLLAPAILSGDFNISGNQLTANLNAKFFINNNNANYKLSVVVVEDGVKGTASGYAQRNYYAGTSEDMGGFENLPDPVPAAQMVYDHVGRALLGGHTGQSNSIPTTIGDGSSTSYTFNYTIPTTYNAGKIYAVVLLIDGTDGTILQAAKLSKTLAVSDVSKIGANTKIYPNPAKSEFNIKLVDDGMYSVKIYDITGREVKNLGEVKSNSKNINVPINLNPGKYLVNITKDGVSFTKDLLVK